VPKLFWLVFKKGKATTLFIQPSGDIVTARVRAMLANVPGKFQEGYELDDKMAKKVPKKLIAKPLDQKQANALLKKLR
jgi:hypothetical protein